MTLWLTLRRSRTLIPVLLILLGAAFRLIDLGTVRVGYDESYQAYLALRLLDGRDLLLIGQPSSVFLDNPPLMAYLQAIPLLFWRSPWAVYLFVTLLNSLATGFVYEGTRKVLGGAAAVPCRLPLCHQSLVSLLQPPTLDTGAAPLLHGAHCLGTVANPRY